MRLSLLLEHGWCVGASVVPPLIAIATQRTITHSKPNINVQKETHPICLDQNNVHKIMLIFTHIDPGVVHELCDGHPLCWLGFQ